MPSLRKTMTDEILAFMDDMDPSGANTERLRQHFDSFKTDDEFYRYMKGFFEDDDRNFQVAYKAYDNPVNMQFIEKIANKHGIPLYEYVYMPYISPNPDDPIATVNKIMVIDYPIKRLKQMVYKKSHTSLSTTKRSSETGQVVNQDKTARVTDAEVYSLIVENQYNAAKEFFGLRADDLKAQAEAQKKIVRDGRLSLNDVSDDPMNRTTQTTMAYYINGCALVTNLLSADKYLIPYTVNTRRRNEIER